MRLIKTISAMLALIFVISAFFACGNENNTSTSPIPADTELKTAFTVTFGEKTIKPLIINDPAPESTQPAIYTRDYKNEDGYSLTVKNAPGRSLLTIRLERNGGNDEFSVIEYINDGASAHIPVNGFVLSVASSELEKVRCAVGSIAIVEGYEQVVPIYEDHSCATLSVNDSNSAAVRRINLVDPKTRPKDNSISLITSGYERGEGFPENRIEVSIKKLTSFGYEVVSQNGLKENSAVSEGEARLIFCGDYNVDFAKCYLTEGARLMINSTDKANGYTDVPAILVGENKVFEFDKERGNVDSVSAEGIYYFDRDYSLRVTPEINNLPRRDVVIADGYIVSVGEIGNRSLIPEGNGMVLTLVGEENVKLFDESFIGTVPTLFYKQFAEIKSGIYVNINGRYFNVDVVDGLRQPEGAVALYTPAYGASTGSNQYGSEVAFENGKVIDCARMKGDMAIPANGYVLSVHKDNEAFDILQDINIGDEASVSFSGPYYSVTDLTLDGVNTVRREDQLIVYRSRSKTGTNVYGYEIIVDKNGVIIGDSETGDSAIPNGGFVLSGHGKMAAVLRDIYLPGAHVSVDNGRKTAILIRTPDLKTFSAREKYEKAAALFEAAKKQYLNIKYNEVGERLKTAENLIKNAEASLLENDVELALENTEKALETMRYLDYEMVESHRVESRAMWYRGYEKSDDEVRKTLEKLKSLNVNALYLETWYDGSFIGFVDVDSVTHTKALGDYDLLEAFTRIGHEMGIEIHAWVENFFVGYKFGDSYTSQIATDFKDKLLVDRKGRDYYYYHENASFVFLDPFDNDCRATVLEIYRQMIEKYDIDGIHLDYIRFPELNYLDGTDDFGYNENTIAAFREATGITEDPRAFKDGTANKKTWVDFRCDIITSFVKEVHDMALDIKPELWISAATYPDVTYAHDSIFQDVAAWVGNGWMDEVFSMTYTGDNDYVYSDARDYMKFCAGKSFYSTGLSAFSDTSDALFVRQPAEARRAGATGVAVFSLGTVDPSNYYYELTLGAFRVPSVQANRLSQTLAAGMDEITDKISNLLPYYKDIDAGDAAKIAEQCKTIKAHAESVDLTEASIKEKYAYCTDTALKQLDILVELIIENCGESSAEAKDLIAEVGVIRDFMELSGIRLKARMG